MKIFKASYVDSLVTALFTLDYEMIDDEHIAIVRDAYKLETARKNLDESILSRLIPVKIYPSEGCHRFDNEIGCINNLRVVIDDSLENKIIIRGPYDKILMELYLQG